jgi:hypothetical protein
MPKPRNPLARGLTFAQFALRQLGRSGAIATEIEALARKPFAAEGVEAVLKGGEPGWKPTGFRVRAGETFTLSARGAIWLAKPLGLVMEPKATLWARIAGAPEIRKPADNDHVFTAWAEGEVELFSKELSEWASPSGDLLSPGRTRVAGEIRVRLALTSGPATASAAPENWRYFWRLGDGTVYGGAGEGRIDIDTHGDVGILQAEVDHPITPATRLEWSWKVDELPSTLPEDVMVTHDYLSVAVEFENGQDLTYMWSASLPHDHVFACPLNFWCDRETHWVLRTPVDGLGRWMDERRPLLADTTRAYGTPPARAVRLWLIANSIFQRGRGLASVSNLRLTEG